MQQTPLPKSRDLVLIGGGHTHALVLRKWGMAPLPGARLTVINPGATSPYSGMLPGFVAGHYSRDDLDIDLLKLARFAGARIILGAVDGIDLDRREIHVPDRPPIEYDLAAIDIGITSDMPVLPGFSEHAVPAKPLGPFAERWQAFRDGLGPARVAVIGGGVAGVELILAMAHALKSRGRFEAAYLIDSAEILGAVGDKAKARLTQALSDQGVTILENSTIKQIDAGVITLETGTSVRAEFVTGTAGARPYDWVGDIGLETESGFICTDRHLRSSDPSVFATGDCAHFSPDPRPKAGVYAVRQAPILFHNLRAALSGRPMQAYKPQKDYLKLISLGDKVALGERFGRTLSGPVMWRWKNQIDQTFMEKFRTLPAMERPPLPPQHTEGMAEAIGDKPMCGGCGAKVGQPALQRALKSVATPPARPDIIPLPGDDAALLAMGDIRQVISTDHLRAFCEDPVVMTQIAANHALGDIWAMGAQPQAALASIVLPRLAPILQERTLSEIMVTATGTMQHAGAAIVGGHSSVGDELTIGFTVTGLCERDPITLSGAQPDDRLILTKPIGSGTLMAGEMAGQAHGHWVAEALRLMIMPQGRAADILQNARAMTDVTGFGLAGHLLGICHASGVAAHLDLGAVPVMTGALDLSAKGMRSSLYPQNAALAPELPEGAKTDLLFDPQTAGGLLATVPDQDGDQILEHLLAAGYPAAIIGKVTDGAPGLSVC